MGIQNWFSRVLMSTWFREITIIDIDNLPKDRGCVVVSWNDGGLFDKMLTKVSCQSNRLVLIGKLMTKMNRMN